VGVDQVAFVGIVQRREQFVAAVRSGGDQGCQAFEQRAVRLYLTGFAVRRGTVLHGRSAVAVVVSGLSGYNKWRGDSKMPAPSVESLSERQSGLQVRIRETQRGQDV